jgi:pimeloyl-ACP methyl ester carboxylesterase
VTYERVEIPAGETALVADRWTGDGPVIVLLHAGVCDRRAWREVGERLQSAGRHAVAYDRRGFGEVPPADRPFRHVDDLLAVIAAVSPDAPAVLVGSSMGGGVALDAALQAPDRVARLVLLAPAVSGDPAPDEATINAETHGLADAIDAAWTASNREECNRLELHLWLDGPAEPEGRVSGPARELALEMNRIVIANGDPEADGASGLETAGRLDEITAPALVACGELDIPTIVRRSAQLAEQLPNASYRALPGRAHLPYLEDADEVAALIGASPRC